MNGEELNATAFKLIKELTREELITDLVDHYRVSLLRHQDECLRRNIIGNRLDDYAERLRREAGLDNEETRMCED